MARFSCSACDYDLCEKCVNVELSRALNSPARRQARNRPSGTATGMVPRVILKMEYPAWYPRPPLGASVTKPPKILRDAMDPP